MAQLLKQIFGSANDRLIKRVLPLVERVNQLEPELAPLSDAALRGKTLEFRGRLANGEPLDDLLPEAFATVREAAKRTLGQRHYDVQVVGGIILHRGVPDPLHENTEAYQPDDTGLIRRVAPAVDQTLRLARLDQQACLAAQGAGPFGGGGVVRPPSRCLRALRIGGDRIGHGVFLRSGECSVFVPRGTSPGAGVGSANTRYVSSRRR